MTMLFENKLLIFLVNPTEFIPGSQGMVSGLTITIIGNSFVNISLQYFQT